MTQLNRMLATELITENGHRFIVLEHPSGGFELIPVIKALHSQVDPVNIPDKSAEWFHSSVLRSIIQDATGALVKQTYGTL